MSEQSNGAIPSGSLHAFFQSNKPQPQPTAISQEVRDRGSTFVAQLFEVSTPEEALARVKYVKNVMHSTKPAAHEVAAWRCMTIKEGRAGLDGVDDFELKSGSKDDGERWAGERVLKVMQNLAVIDAVVIVSRWFGGTLLGGARFDHIETCTTEVCQQFRRSEELRDCISSLNEMDGQLEKLRAELAGLNPTPSSTPASLAQEPAIRVVGKPPNYKLIDLGRGKRIMRARESAIKNMKILIANRRKENSAESNNPAKLSSIDLGRQFPESLG